MIDIQLSLAIKWSLTWVFSSSHFHRIDLNDYINRSITNHNQRPSLSGKTRLCIISRWIRMLLHERHLCLYNSMRDLCSKYQSMHDVYLTTTVTVTPQTLQWTTCRPHLSFLPVLVSIYYWLSVTTESRGEHDSFGGRPTEYWSDFKLLYVAMYLSQDFYHFMKNKVLRIIYKLINI